MNALKILITVLLFSGPVQAQILFQGLVEKSSINKNTFLCPASASDGVQGCMDEQSAAHGFDVSGGRTIQFCNNQQYWLQQETLQAQYISTVRNYTGSSLQEKLRDEGWTSMGGYAVVISTNPFLLDYVMPELVAQSGQVKVVVQLWYNGSDMIQLWSEDAIILDEGSGFNVTISSDTDDRLASLLAAAKSMGSSWKDNFLAQLNVQPDNRKKTDYQDANGSPRQVRLARA